MWCRNCNIETNEYTCPVCGEETTEDLPVEIYWCDECKVPIIQTSNQVDKGICPICGKPTRYLSTDLRPVFPEERLLIELLLGKEPHKWIDCSVWASNNRYYVNGKAIALPSKLFKDAGADELRAQIEKYKEQNQYDYFNSNIELFVKANKDRLNYLIDEAHEFIRKKCFKNLQ